MLTNIRQAVVANEVRGGALIAPPLRDGTSDLAAFIIHNLREMPDFSARELVVTVDDAHRAVDRFAGPHLKHLANGVLIVQEIAGRRDDCDVLTGEWIFSGIATFVVGETAAASVKRGNVG